jgi:hypothetical protein
MIMSFHTRDTEHSPLLSTSKEGWWDEKISPDELVTPMMVVTFATAWVGLETLSG